ncbi:MAG TPA: multiheme c-type cytochrome [Kofleriaceae bacterium]|nr:multiheme c-type cytochrome [Kofleriaceae bacterium]
MTRAAGIAGAMAASLAGSIAASVAGSIVASVAASAALGCGVAPAAGPAPAAVRDEAPAWRVRAPGGMAPIDPGLPADALLDARGCASCHAAIVDEWSRSRHALAWTNTIFQTEYTITPQPWCVNCHAPLTTQQADLAGPRAAQGVDCATCHVRAGKLVAKTRRAGSPHETIGEPSFGSPAFCADCHQFTFPVLSPEGAALRMTPHPMQTTVASFQAGPYARERGGCLACHGSRHGHAYPGAHDAALLEGAVEVAWCREPRADAGGEDQALRVTVRNAAAGHTLPTGDIHRHMYLRLWRSSAPEAMFQAFFGRRFDPAEDGGKTTSWDSTIAPGAAKTVRLDLDRLGGEAGEPVSLELVYVFIGNEFPRETIAPDEPAATSVVRRRAAVAELPPCDR